MVSLLSPVPSRLLLRPGGEFVHCSVLVSYLSCKKRRLAYLCNRKQHLLKGSPYTSQVRHNKMCTMIIIEREVSARFRVQYNIKAIENAK